MLLLIFFALLQPMPTHTLTVDGQARTYHVYVPATINAPAPLVLVLHGGGGRGPQMHNFTGFNQLADEAGFIVVYPDGLDQSWNDGRVYRNAPLAVDDVAFFDALLDDMIANYPVDVVQVYATGISNGGFMSFRLGCELSHRLAGIAPVTATLSVDLAATCAPTHPLKVLMINGTGDPLVPYDGGTVALFPRVPRGEILSSAVTLDFWANHNHCQDTLPPVDLPDSDPRDGTTATQTTYTGCDASVQLLTIVDGGHTWPGGSQYLPVGVIGRVSRDVAATRYIWNFWMGDDGS